MKLQTVMLAAVFALSASFVQAQTSTTGDPAASSQNAKGDKTGMSPATTSGSGTSTSGGKDANGDQGRDKMPDSNMDVKQQPGKPNITNPGAK